MAHHRGRAARAARRAVLRAVLRCSLIAAVVALSGLTGLGLAGPASAAVVVCPPVNSGVCNAIVPIAECYWKNGNGTNSFVWGWNNPTTDTANITVGSTYNKVTPANSQTQPGTFPPGLKHNAFFTVTTADSASFRLGNTTVTAQTDQAEGNHQGQNTPACVTKPVSVIGSAGALLLGLALMLAVGLPVIAARRAGREVSL